ncbi:unnamed protein product [Knipowitschia caucasica]|uniref:Uncharacterized protein n=1 Tax=Knipowitschia caucasica TaxID=637954 RepID=A0AAV2J1K8_KNICA
MRRERESGPFNLIKDRPGGGFGSVHVHQSPMNDATKKHGRRTGALLAVAPEPISAVPRAHQRGPRSPSAQPPEPISAAPGAPTPCGGP